MDEMVANSQLAKMMDSLTQQRRELQQMIYSEEEEKRELTAQIKKLQNRKVQVEESLKNKNGTLADYNQAITTTSDAFNTIIKSSQNLVSQLKDTSDKLFRSKINSSGDGDQPKEWPPYFPAKPGDYPYQEDIQDYEPFPQPEYMYDQKAGDRPHAWQRAINQENLINVPKSPYKSV